MDLRIRDEEVLVNFESVANGDCKTLEPTLEIEAHALLIQLAGL